LKAAKAKSASIEDCMEINNIRDALKVRILVMIEQLNHALEKSAD
jgi:hypothetical protein